MYQIVCYLSAILVLATTLGLHIPSVDNIFMKHWNYGQNGRDWRGWCRYGRSQSPIDLKRRTSTYKKLPKIQFGNYYQNFMYDSLLYNSGHTFNFVIGQTAQFEHLYISGANLDGRYIAEEFHFHWGSLNGPGSEHTIDGKKFDIEMHIVHRHQKFASIKAAAMHPKGLAVLGIMIDIVKFGGYDNNMTDTETVQEIATQPLAYNSKYSRTLHEFLRALVRIQEFKSSTRVNSLLTIGSMLEHLNTNQYFTYQGSLTTPGCFETVHWIVFANPIQVKMSPAFNLFLLRNLDRTNMLYNYRVTQPILNRNIIYRY